MFVAAITNPKAKTDHMTHIEHNSFDNAPWIVRLVDFTKKVLAQNRVRLIGVCFGHQIIGRALGAKVDRSPIGWEISVSPVKLSTKGEELFGQKDLAINQMHRDIVFPFPYEKEGIELLGSSERCEVQGMYQQGRLLTVQGHPEFNEAIMAEILEARHANGVFDDNMFEEGRSRVGRRQDGVVVAQAFLRFLLED